MTTEFEASVFEASMSHFLAPVSRIRSIRGRCADEMGTCSGKGIR